MFSASSVKAMSESSQPGEESADPPFSPSSSLCVSCWGKGPYFTRFCLVSAVSMSLVDSRDVNRDWARFFNFSNKDSSILQKGSSIPVFSVNYSERDVRPCNASCHSAIWGCIVRDKQVVPRVLGTPGVLFLWSSSCCDSSLDSVLWIWFVSCYGWSLCSIGFKFKFSLSKGLSLPQ